MRKTIKISPLLLAGFIILAVLCLITFCTGMKFDRDIEDEDVPITIGYERVAITNLQSTENGTYIYVLKDTATNREYLYVLRESGRVGHADYVCTSSIVEIGDVIEARVYENVKTEELISRNELSHTGMYTAYENGVKCEP